MGDRDEGHGGGDGRVFAATTMWSWGVVTIVVVTMPTVVLDDVLSMAAAVLWWWS